MSDSSGNILICSCDNTIKLDAGAIRTACGGAQVTLAHQLCGAELARFEAIAGDTGPLTVCCPQEAALFSEESAEAGRANKVTYVNIRETAGWSSDAASAGPKMAALLAAAAEPMPDVPFIALQSQGVVLIYGRDEQAIEAGDLLKEHLDVTVLIKPPADVTPPRVNYFPLAKGTIRSAKGHLGAFEITVDDFARPAPSSRAASSFGPSRDGAVSRADIILDLSGSSALFSAGDLRDGYLRADPNNPAAILNAVLRARDLVGTFNKPRYITFSEHLCAHSRSRITGCTRCLDLCPAGAIAPAGDHVAIDPAICAGCGQCAGACPTGAASYAMPPADGLMRKLRAMLLAYRRAGGERAVLLLHDEPHGTPLIDALARFGDGLPAAVLPLSVNEVTQVGLETIAAAFAYGASAMRFLLRARPRHDTAGLTGTIAVAEPILAGLCFHGELGVHEGRIATIETDDPDVLGSALRAIPAMATAVHPSSFLPMSGEKRSVLRLALRELHRVAPRPTDVVALPRSAPFGSVKLDVSGCTLCLSCVAACPTGALAEDPERPMLRFTEDACVQCGLCQATCPEKVITLEPQMDFRPTTATARVLKEEEPFCCVRCGKPFGVKSSIERVVAKLAGKHWMYKDSPGRLDLIKMCDDCRVAFVSEENFDPYGAPRKLVRTTDDYLRKRDEGAATRQEKT
jgi:ferredoxin